MKSVIIELEKPHGGHPGRAAEGYYTVAGGTVTACLSIPNDSATS